jgi:hypothetical protein
MSANFQLDGFDNVINIIRAMPEDGYRKPVVAAFKKAAVPIRDSMIAALPSNLKGMKKVIKIKPGKGKSMTLAVGPFGRQLQYRNNRGVNWDPYMLIYWSNYGTYAGRDPGHSFQYKRRKKTAGYAGGIKAGLFIEHAVESSIPQAEKIFEKTYEEEHIKFLEKLAAK